MSVEIDFENHIVALRANFKPLLEFGEKLERDCKGRLLFVATGGFGCSPYCTGSKVYGYFVNHPETHCYVRRGDVVEIIKKITD